MRYRLVPLFGLLAFCVLLASCGGSTSGPATATATVAVPTRAASAASVPATTTTAAPAATAPPVIISATPAASATSSASTPSAAGGNTVAVELKDYAITLSTSTVSAGMVTFAVKNSGPSSHNFNVTVDGEEKGVPTLDAGKAMTVTLDLKAGSYDFRCAVPGHSLLGMKGTLTVK